MLLAERRLQTLMIWFKKIRKTPNERSEERELETRTRSWNKNTPVLFDWISNEMVNIQEKLASCRRINGKKIFPTSRLHKPTALWGLLHYSRHQNLNEKLFYNQSNQLLSYYVTECSCTKIIPMHDFFCLGTHGEGQTPQSDNGWSTNDAPTY